LTNVFTAFERVVGEQPQRPALLEGSSVITYGELERRVGAVAAALAGRGLTSGDSVALLIPPSPELYVAVLAMLKLAVTAVFVETARGVREVARAVETIRPSAVIGTLKAHVLVRPKAPERFVTGSALPGLVSLSSLVRERHAPVATASTSGATAAFAGYTSGTTGTPKLVTRTHAGLWEQHRALAAAFAVEPTDVVLSPLPLFVLHDLARGAAAIVPGSAAEVEPTLVRGTPRFFAELIRTRARLPRVRAAFVGGAPVRPRLLAALAKVLPAADVHVVYGCTEAEPIAAISAKEVLAETAPLTAAGHGLCVGRPLPGTTVNVLDERDGVGEVVVSGAHVGGNGSYRTGDSGYVDARGRIWLAGRVDDAVATNGRLVHPLQVEQVVETLPFVEHTALIGVADGSRGERAVLVVAPRLRGAKRAALARACKSLPIDEVVFARSLPLDRRHRSKVQRAALRRRYG
jgi:olefin beta-lactone synthetase